MAGKRKKTKNNGSGRRVWPALRTGLIACFVSLLGAGLYLTGRAVVQSVAADPTFEVDPVQLSLSLPPCVKSTIHEELGLQLSYLRATSIFEPSLPVMVGQVLERSPWVLRVNRVTRRLPNNLLLELEFRKPAGMVAVGEQRYLVDEEGYWLPGRFFEWPGAEAPPVIAGETITRWPPRGSAWEEPAVRAGALMTGFLATHAEHLKGLKVARIDVSNFGRRRQTGKSCLVLVTESGTQIKWGCSPLCSLLPGLCRPAGELTDEEKLEGLERVLRLRPGLEGCELVDVRFRRPVIKSAGAEGL